MASFEQDNAWGDLGAFGNPMEMNDVSPPAQTSGKAANFGPSGATRVDLQLSIMRRLSVNGWHVPDNDNRNFLLARPGRDPARATKIILPSTP